MMVRLVFNAEADKLTQECMRLDCHRTVGDVVLAALREYYEKRMPPAKITELRE
jgi:hypothetical protein